VNDNGTAVGLKPGNNGERAGEIKTEGDRQDAASLISKLARVMGRVGRVQKSGHNKYHGYDYATESDIVQEVRGHLADECVFLFSTVKDWELEEFKSKSGTQHLARVELLFTFADGETGAAITVRYIGEGIDSGDKAFYKAYTGAVKYMLLKNFLIGTGDDPEESSPERGEKKERDRSQASKSSSSPLEVIRRMYRHSPEIVQEAAFKKFKDYDMDEDISLLTELEEKDLREILKEVTESLKKQIAS